MDTRSVSAKLPLSRRQFVKTLSVTTVSCATVATGAESGRLAKRDLQRTCVERGLRFLAAAECPEGKSGSSVVAMAVATTAMLRHGVIPRPSWLGTLSDMADLQLRGETRPSLLDICSLACSLSLANENGRNRDLLDRAERYVRSCQWSDSRQIESDDLGYGGVGHGSLARPDLFCTSLFVDTLIACGCHVADRAIQQAVVFVSRCQNVESAYNTTPLSVLNPDGGFYDSCVAGGRSEAGSTKNGGLRSYGSATCDGVRTMVRAGLARDDPRVEVALSWVGRNCTARENAGIGDTGLFYSFQRLAETLSFIGTDHIQDASGKMRSWREELVAELANRQACNGSWRNPNGRWMEDEPVVATSRALLALACCK